MMRSEKYAVGLIVSILALAGVGVAASLGVLPNMLSRSDLWASIVGAIVGGSIAICGQLITIEEARKQRGKEKNASDIASATSMLFKLVKIFSNFQNVGRYMTFCVEEEPKSRNLKGEAWMFFRPIASVPDDINFTSAEMSLLLSIAPAALFSKCMALDDIHNGFLASINKLGELRSALLAQLEPDSTVGDLSSGHFLVTPRQRAEMNAINSLIERLRFSCAIDEVRSGTSVDEVAALFRARLGMTVSVELKAERPDVIV